MIKVITYGTFDFLHEGHMNLLKRAKALGDYLLVGVTTSNFDVTRGKINVRQTLMERIEAVRNTGIADEVFPEEYIGQKIDDIKRNDVSIFAIGSDWEGQFDYLNEYCSVIYLPRTEGISSSQIRSENIIEIGVIGDDPALIKMKHEVQFINGLQMNFIFCKSDYFDGFTKRLKSYDDLLQNIDAVYVASRFEERYEQIEHALMSGKHIISESPIAPNQEIAKKLFQLADKKNLVLFESIKTAYSLTFERLILLIKSGIIGDIKSLDITCTSLENLDWLKKTNYYSSITGWGSIGMLPIFKIFGTKYRDVHISTLNFNGIKDAFSKINFIYEQGLATLNVGIGVKSESDMRIAGTNGYIYIPSPWWKSEYFEVRFENSNLNKPFYYQNNGEGLQMELVHFLQCINNRTKNYYIERNLTEKICDIMNIYLNLK